MRKSTDRLALKLAVFAVAMLGFGFGLVPLYDVICDITGLNGKTGSITESRAGARVVDESRAVTVEFVAGLNQSMNWRFAPTTKQLQVKPGEIHEVSYLVKNRNAFRTVGQAVPSVAPAAAAPFFDKIECFCFSEQALEPGEERLMPVRFVVAAELPEHVTTVSLAYTFFDITDKPESGRT